MKTILIDAGHGGLDPTTGKYTTPGKKQYYFEQHNVHVYEGEINRSYAEVLRQMLHTHGYRVYDVNHPWQDTPLKDRVDLANTLHRIMGGAIYISLHNNAASPSLSGTGSRASGTEGYTMQGHSSSDVIIQHQFEALGQYLPGRKIRRDCTDGDDDKEALFYVLKNTHCPAVLWEFGFFDNWPDYRYITDPDNITRFCAALVDGLNNYFKTK